jgi:hypothetical protein
MDNIVLELYGMFVVPASQGGVWTFTFTCLDDAAYLWIGDTAQSGYTAANANLASGIGGPYSVSINLLGGSMNYIRLQYAEYVGNSCLTLQFTPPLGTPFSKAKGYLQPVSPSVISGLFYRIVNKCNNCGTFVNDPTFFNNNPADVSGYSYDLTSINTITNNYKTANSADNFAIELFGYFVVPADQGGVWTLSFTNIDDVGYLWIGDKALSGYSNANADLIAVLGSNTTSVYLAGDSMNYLRIHYIEYTLTASFNLLFTSPSGVSFSKAQGYLKPIPPPIVNGLLYRITKAPIYQNPAGLTLLVDVFNYYPTVVTGYSTDFTSFATTTNNFAISTSFVMELFGVFVVPSGQGGVWTFGFKNILDVAFLWVGDKALSGFNSDNRDLYAVSSTNATFAVNLLAGSKTYIRIQYGQVYGTIGFQFLVKSPALVSFTNAKGYVQSVPSCGFVACDATSNNQKFQYDSTSQSIVTAALTSPYNRYLDMSGYKLNGSNLLSLQYNRRSAQAFTYDKICSPGLYLLLYLRTA